MAMTETKRQGGVKPPHAKEAGVTQVFAFSDFCS
jgi:hypothetical protein